MSGNTTLNRSSHRMHFSLSLSSCSARPLLVNSPRLGKRSQALRGPNLTRDNQVRAGECSRRASGRNAPCPLQPKPNILLPCLSSQNPSPYSFHPQILVTTRIWKHTSRCNSTVGHRSHASKIRRHNFHSRKKQPHSLSIPPNVGRTPPTVCFFAGREVLMAPPQILSRNSINRPTGLTPFSLHFGRG